MTRRTLITFLCFLKSIMWDYTNPLVCLAAILCDMPGSAKLHHCALLRRFELNTKLTCVDLQWKWFYDSSCTRHIDVLFLWRSGRPSGGKFGSPLGVDELSSSFENVLIGFIRLQQRTNHLAVHNWYAFLLLSHLDFSRRTVRQSLLGGLPNKIW